MTNAQKAAVRRYIKTKGLNAAAQEARVAVPTLLRVLEGSSVHGGSVMMVEAFAKTLGEEAK